MRNEFFKVSGIRAKYPQLFVREGDAFKFIGMYDEIEQLNDSRKLKEACGAGSGREMRAEVGKAKDAE